MFHILAILKYLPLTSKGASYSQWGGKNVVGGFIFLLRMSQKMTLHLATDSALDSMRFTLLGLKLVIEVIFSPKYPGWRAQFLQFSTQHPGPHL